MREPSDCACGPIWRAPKPNGTCAACGGWLPGQRPLPFFDALSSSPVPKENTDAPCP